MKQAKSPELKGSETVRAQFDWRYIESVLETVEQPLGEYNLLTVLVTSKDKSPDSQSVIARIKAREKYGVHQAVELSTVSFEKEGYVISELKYADPPFGIYGMEHYTCYFELAVVEFNTEYLELDEESLSEYLFKSVRDLIKPNGQLLVAETPGSGMMPVIESGSDEFFSFASKQFWVFGLETKFNFTESIAMARVRSTAVNEVGRNAVNLA